MPRTAISAPKIFLLPAFFDLVPSFRHSFPVLSLVLVLPSCFSSLILCVSLLPSFAMLIYVALLAFLWAGPGLVSALTLDLKDQGKYPVPDDCSALSNR